MKILIIFAAIIIFLTLTLALLHLLDLRRFRKDIKIVIAVMLFSAAICVSINMLNKPEQNFYVCEMADRKPSGPTLGISEKGRNITTVPKNSLGVIDINRAEPYEFTSLNGIGRVKAESIVRMRSEIGSFKSVDDLICVSGISRNTLSGFRNFVEVK